MNFVEENIREAPPTLPELQAPSITPTVPQVSVIFDEPIISRSNKELFHGNDFQTFQSWRHCEPEWEKRQREMLKGRFVSDRYNSATSNSKSTEIKDNTCKILDLITEQFASFKMHIAHELKANQVEINTLMNDIREEIQQLKVSRKPFTTSTATQTSNLILQTDKAINTDSYSKVNRGVQTQFIDMQDVGINTENSELDNEEDGGHTFYRKAQEQLDAMLEADGNKYQFQKDSHARTSEVSLVQDAFLRKYISPEKLEECKPKLPAVDVNKFAVFNMTNVSLAMGYHPDSDQVDFDLPGPALRNYYPKIPQNYYDPYRYDIYNRPPRDLYYPQSANHRDDERRRPSRKDDKLLDLTAIKQQPKLL